MAKTVTVRNIPDDVYKRIKRDAKLHHRSMNNEIINVLEKNKKNHRIDKEQMLLKARKLRELTKDHLLTDEEINDAKNDGRL